MLKRVRFYGAKKVLIILYCVMLSIPFYLLHYIHLTDSIKPYRQEALIIWIITNVPAGIITIRQMARPQRNRR